MSGIRRSKMLSTSEMIEIMEDDSAFVSDNVTRIKGYLDVIMDLCDMNQTLLKRLHEQDGRIDELESRIKKLEKGNDIGVTYVDKNALENLVAAINKRLEAVEKSYQTEDSVPKYRTEEKSSITEKAKKYF